MKVAFFTMFKDLNYNNPTVTVVENHIAMLLKNNIDITIFVCEHFLENSKRDIFLHKNIKWQKVINSHNGVPFKWYDYDQENGKVHKSFEKEVKSVTNDLILKLKGYNFCFLYDIITKGQFLVHNTAIREVSKTLTSLKFFSYVFEKNLCKKNRDFLTYPFSNMCTGFENLSFISNTYESIEEVAKHFEVPQGLCSVVSSSFFGVERMSREVKIIHKFFNLYDSDFLTVIPTNLDTDEQLEKVCMLLGSIEHNCKKTCKVIFCDFESEQCDFNKEKYKTIIKSLGEDYNFNIKNILFTSDLGFEKGLKEETILELFKISNLYVNLSKCRTDFKYLFYAIESSNFLVLNGNQKAFKELSKNFSIYYLEQDYISFGEECIIDFKDGEYNYFKEVACDIVKKFFGENLVVNKRKIYQTFNIDWIYYNQFEPLLKR